MGAGEGWGLLLGLALTLCGAAADPGERGARARVWGGVLGPRRTGEPPTPRFQKRKEVGEGPASSSLLSPKGERPAK